MLGPWFLHIFCRSLSRVSNPFGSCIHAAQHHSEGKTVVVVRVPKHDEISLSTSLDAGAAGVIFPHMESAEDVKEMIKKVYYRA